MLRDKKAVIFDMDGTLVDSLPGIYEAYRRSFSALGLPFGGESFVRSVIGAPLTDVFTKICGLNPTDCAKAVEQYRAYYRAQGKNEITTYAGMTQALEQLYAYGLFLGVATLKNEQFAKEILKAQKLLPYFHIVHGMDDAHTSTKAGLICNCMHDVNVQPTETILIGDSIYDAKGAKEAKVSFLAVTYGFGFQNSQAALAAGAVATAATPNEISAWICGGDQKKKKKRPFYSWGYWSY